MSAIVKADVAERRRNKSMGLDVHVKDILERVKLARERVGWVAYRKQWLL
jgi:hypothetical protein